MNRSRHQRTGQAHYCLFCNPKAANYSDRAVQRLVAAIRKKGRQYSVLQPTSAMELNRIASEVASTGLVPESGSGRKQKLGKVTSLVAAGGDGTVNLVGRAALEASLPLGIMPMGQFNNISRSLFGQLKPDETIDAILGGAYRMIDAAQMDNQIFFGSIGLGLIPALAGILSEEKEPRYKMGWKKLGLRAADEVQPMNIILKVDAFRFEIKPRMLNVNLLPYSAGLPLSPASVADDARAEVIFDKEVDSEEFGDYVRLLLKDSFQYGNDIGLYRSEIINIQLPQGALLYLDGERLNLQAQVLEIKCSDKKLKVFSAK